MPTDDPKDPRQPALPGDESPRLSDGREGLGESLVKPVPRDDRELSEDFLTRNQYDGHELANEFEDPTYADRRGVAAAFEDPDALDDRKLGKSFEQTNSSAKKHHKPIKEVVEAPFKKPASRKIFFWVIAAIVIVGIIALIVGFLPRHGESKDAEKESGKFKDKPVVEYMKVTRAKDSAGLVLPGTTTPLTESAVYARASGYLKKRFVDIGDHVHKGQLLAIIDAPDLDQQVDQAREQVRQAEAQADQQRTQLALNKVTNDRYQALVARGVFSRQDGDQQEANYRAQIANVASADRNIEAFKANLRRVIALQSYERVTAPFDGVVTQRNVDEGAYISTAGSAGSNAPTPMATGSQGGSSQSTNGMTNTSGSSGNAASLATPSTGGGQGGALFSIAQNTRLRILVSVPEGYAEQVRPGFPASLQFQEFPNQTFHGNVTRNSGSIDQNSRTLLTEIQVDNSNNKLLPGMYAVVTFAATGGSGPLVVSGDSIAVRKDRPTVALIENGKVRLQPVVIGRDYGPTTEIVSGLKEGDFVASTFTDDITEGREVDAKEDTKQEQKLNPPPPPAKATPPGGSTQYSDPGVTDQDMQGQNAKPQQKQSQGKKATSKGGNQ